MKSKLSLDAKVAEFRARVAASNMKESDMAMMQKHFSRTELRALWSRMATQRNKEYITIRQPWTELTSIPSEVANQSKGSCHQVKNDGKPGYCDVWNQVDNSIAKNSMLNFSHGDNCQFNMVNGRHCNCSGSAR